MSATEPGYSRDRKFQDPSRTADGKARAKVPLQALRTLWFNTGTLCNLTCAGCYIESSPRNDRLAYLSAAEVESFLDEIARQQRPTEEIGFTGGEPFMNPALLAMLSTSLARGFRVLVLTNAMRPMMRHADGLLDLRRHFGHRLVMRVSIDHYTQAGHEAERGPRSWAPTIAGLKWLNAHGFALRVAGRRLSGEAEFSLRRGYAGLFAEHGIALDAFDPDALVLFPEMDKRADVPEITEACWSILGVSPDALMCASSRMVVKRKGATKPAVLSCTLLAYDAPFELGSTLSEADQPVSLNHPFCAQFCVLGGGSCSASQSAFRSD
jgi:uncharacterized Fe-S cluster-containing radical SAM superfamily protein